MLKYFTLQRDIGMQSLQDELDKAFNKELFLIQNDIYYQQIELEKQGKKELLRVDISYKPYSALSGDTYSLRKTQDGRLVGFIADAMGKGLSAAMSAMGLTRFLNYFFDELEEELGGFVFEKWSHKMLKFLQKNLLGDEILCIMLIEFDVKHSLVRYASCGMPALLIETQTGELVSIKSNNPPLGSYSESILVKALISTQMHKMLCYTDGLSESFTEDGKPYALMLKEDFKEAQSLIAFRTKVQERIGNGDDDLTYVYIQKSSFYKSFETLFIPSTYEAVDEALESISEYLKSHLIRSKCRSEILLAFSELLLNALEHGSFGVNKTRKNYLIENDLFDDEMSRLEALHQEKMICIRFSIVSDGCGELFEAVVEDDGTGFDTKILKNLVINPHSFNGRGFMIIKKLVDHFYFNEKGNAITILKRVERSLELQ